MAQDLNRSGKEHLLGKLQHRARAVSKHPLSGHFKDQGIVNRWSATRSRQIVTRSGVSFSRSKIPMLSRASFESGHLVMRPEVLAVVHNTA